MTIFKHRKTPLRFLSVPTSFGLLLVLHTATAEATEPDLSELTPAQQGVFKAVVQEEYCSCNSSLTLAGCFASRPNCPLAEDLAEVVRVSAAADVSRDDLLLFMSEHVMGPYCKKANTFNTAGAPSKGATAEKAEHTVVEFADFRCSHCRAAAPNVKKTAAMARNKNVRFVFMPFPLQDNPESVAAAEAALAGQAQGKFWPMHDQLFALQDRGFTSADIRYAATRAGLDMKRFDAAMRAHTYRAQVMKYKAEGNKVGIQGTPAFYIDGRLYRFDPVVVTFNKRFMMEKHRTVGQCE